MSDAWRDLVVDVAKSWLRTPWQHCAAVKGAGVDCAQLLRCVYTEAGLVDGFETGNYPPDWMMHRDEERFLGFITQHMEEISAPQMGDAAVWMYGRCFSHGGIVIGWPMIIHAYRKERGVVYGDGTKGEFVGREVKFFTPKVA